MSGAVTPAASMRCLISGTAGGASGTFTVTRTISEPASASSMHCCAVAAASAVSVIVIDCTITGAPPPTWTVPTRTPMVLCSFTVDMSQGAGGWGQGHGAGLNAAPWLSPQPLPRILDDHTIRVPTYLYPQGVTAALLLHW